MKHLIDDTEYKLLMLHAAGWGFKNLAKKFKIDESELRRRFSAKKKYGIHAKDKSATTQ